MLFLAVLLKEFKFGIDNVGVRQKRLDSEKRNSRERDLRKVAPI